MNARLAISAALSLNLIGCASQPERFRPPGLASTSTAADEASEACRREVLATFKGSSKADNTEAAGTGAMLGGALLGEAVVFNPIVGLAMAPVALAAGAVAGVADSRRRAARTTGEMNRLFADCMIRRRSGAPTSPVPLQGGLEQLRSLGVDVGPKAP